MNFPLEKFNPFEIGLHPIDKKDWLSLNSSDSIYIQNKHRLIKENIQDVYFVSEDHKQDIFDLAISLQSDLIEQETELQERLDLALQETGIKSINHDNALLVLSLLVEDDLVILRSEEDSFKMIAGAPAIILKESSSDLRITRSSSTSKDNTKSALSWLMDLIPVSCSAKSNLSCNSVSCSMRSLCNDIAKSKMSCL